MGDVYYATDTKITYVCYVATIWVANAHIYLGSGEEFRVYNSSGTERLQFDEDGNMQIDGDLTVTGDILESGNIQFGINGGGSSITTGVKGFIQVPWNCTITSVTLLSDVSTTTTVDIWVDTLANYPPTDADSITAAAVPTITTDTDSTDSTLTGWTTTVTAGDCIGFNVDANDNATLLTVVINYTRT